MLIGVDFDNTIARYDGLFHRLAMDRGLIDATVPVTKTAVRDALRSAGREADWTELQGQVYGPRIVEAEPFPGFDEFLVGCRDTGIRVVVVSHKTRVPYRGPAYDLHAAADAFLEIHGLNDHLHAVYLEPTLSAKLARIARLGCDLFVDDLPELFHEPDFSGGIRKVLFDPAEIHPDHPTYLRVKSWSEASRIVLHSERGR